MDYDFERHKVLKSCVFGRRSRYKIEKIHTRFDTIVYFVSDAEQVDEVTEELKIIRQTETILEAMAGLNHHFPTDHLAMRYLAEKLAIH